MSVFTKAFDVVHDCDRERDRSLECKRQARDRARQNLFSHDTDIAMQAKAKIHIETPNIRVLRSVADMRSTQHLFRPLIPDKQSYINFLAGFVPLSYLQISFLRLDDNERAIGVIGLQLDHDGVNRTLRLRDLHVDPAYRGCSIARALVRRAFLFGKHAHFQKFTVALDEMHHSIPSDTLRQLEVDMVNSGWSRVVQTAEENHFCVSGLVFTAKL